MTATSTSVHRLLLTGCAAVLVAGCGAAESRSEAVSGAPAPSGPDGPASSAPSGPNAAQLSEPCPVHPDDVLAGQSQDVRVKPGATRARLCLNSVDLAPSPAPGQPAGPVPVARTLEGGQAADLAARYVDLAPVSGDRACRADLGPTVTVLFGYADESVAAVATELYGCEASRVAPEQEPPLGDPSPSDLAEVLRDTADGRTGATTLP